jgi:hypothetical protein
LGVKFLTVT